MLAGKAAVVTGAGRGIGRATSIAFANAGARVLLVDRDESSLEECAALISTTGAEVYAIVGDVTRSDDVQRYVQEALARFGSLDVLFNNAGIEGPVAPIAADRFRAAPPSRAGRPVASVGRIDHPTLRCSSTPLPMNRARMDRMKLPLIRFQTK